MVIEIENSIWDISFLLFKVKTILGKKIAI